MGKLVVDNTCATCGKPIDDDQTMYVIKRGKLTNVSHYIPKYVYVDVDGGIHDEIPARIPIGERYLRTKCL